MQPLNLHKKETADGVEGGHDEVDKASHDVERGRVDGVEDYITDETADDLDEGDASVQGAYKHITSMKATPAYRAPTNR